MKLKTTLLSLLIGIATIVPSFAGKPTGQGKPGGGGTAFTFTYNLGTVTNYHAYGFYYQDFNPQPAGAVDLVYWWVQDLGPVSGSGTIACPTDLSVRHQVNDIVGMLLFANAADVGAGEAYSNPVAMVILQTSGVATIQVADPGGTGPVLYSGGLFSPFSWDLSPYVWNVAP